MSEPTMPELYDRLVTRTAEWATQNPARPERLELHSERVLTGTDDKERVHVTMRDFQFEELRIDPTWFESAGVDAVRFAVTEAVNSILKRYLEAELNDATEAATDMESVHRELLGFSGEFHAAFNRTMDDLSDRMRRA